jgi:hypothetical protein
MENDYEGTVSSVLRFLNVPAHPDEALGVPRVNVSGTPRLAIVQRFIWAATRNELLRTAIKRTTSFRFRERVRLKTLRSSTVDAAARSHLQGHFVEDLRDVYRLVDRPAPAWLAVHRSG